jgi:hypothetical protein
MDRGGGVAGACGNQQNGYEQIPHAPQTRSVAALHIFLGAAANAISHSDL